MEPLLSPVLRDASLHGLSEPDGLALHASLAASSLGPFNHVAGLAGGAGIEGIRLKLLADMQEYATAVGREAAFGVPPEASAASPGALRSIIADATKLISLSSAGAAAAFPSAAFPSGPPPVSPLPALRGLPPTPFPAGFYSDAHTVASPTVGRPPVPEHAAGMLPVDDSPPPPPPAGPIRAWQDAPPPAVPTVVAEPTAPMSAPPPPAAAGSGRVVRAIATPLQTAVQQPEHRGAAVLSPRTRSTSAVDTVLSTRGASAALEAALEQLTAVAEDKKRLVAAFDAALAERDEQWLQKVTQEREMIANVVEHLEQTAGERLTSGSAERARTEDAYARELSRQKNLLETKLGEIAAACSEQVNALQGKVLKFAGEARTSIADRDHIIQAQQQRLDALQSQVLHLSTGRPATPSPHPARSAHSARLLGELTRLQNQIVQSLVENTAAAGEPGDAAQEMLAETLRSLLESPGDSSTSMPTFSFPMLERVLSAAAGVPCAPPPLPLAASASNLTTGTAAPVASATAHPPVPLLPLHGSARYPSVSVAERPAPARASQPRKDGGVHTHLSCSSFGGAPPPEPPPGTPVRSRQPTAISHEFRALASGAGRMDATCTTATSLPTVPTALSTYTTTFGHGPHDSVFASPDAGAAGSGIAVSFPTAAVAAVGADGKPTPSLELTDAMMDAL